MSPLQKQTVRQHIFNIFIGLQLPVAAMLTSSDFLPSASSCENAAMHMSPLLHPRHQIRELSDKRIGHTLICKICNYLLFFFDFC